MAVDRVGERARGGGSHQKRGDGDTQIRRVLIVSLCFFLIGGPCLSSWGCAVFNIGRRTLCSSLMNPLKHNIKAIQRSSKVLQYSTQARESFCLFIDVFFLAKRRLIRRRPRIQRGWTTWSWETPLASPMAMVAAQTTMVTAMSSPRPAGREVLHSQ